MIFPDVQSRPTQPIPAPVTASGERVLLSEVVSALSFALDLVEDAVPGHAVRSCLLGMRIGLELRLSTVQLHDLYYALLLKDVGCSSNSARMCQILGGDDRQAKRAVKTVDWTKITPQGLQTAWANTLPGASPWRKTARIIKLGLQRDRNNAEMIGLRCERGAGIARKIGLSDECGQAIFALDEHWDGSGYPDRLKRDRIPLLARVLGVAQHLDVFAGEQGEEAALRTLKERSGTWFDPDLVRVTLGLARRDALWLGCRTPNERDLVVAIEPGLARAIDADQIDRVCEAFADVVDAKASFTYRHSLGVMEAAVGIARQLGFPPDRLKVIYRAALLHDLGKLNVSNSILDKPGRLDAGEWLKLREHPRLSREILARIPSFAEIATIAGRHHERLDGSGYPDRLRAEQLTLEDRIVALADVYGALSEDRPYRAGLPLEKILSMLREDLPAKLDVVCFEALLAHIGQS